MGREESVEPILICYKVFMIININVILLDCVEQTSFT